MWLDVDFGAGKDGLATVGYRQFNNSGSDAVARTTTGIEEIGHGAYGADVTIDAAAVGVQWDTGEVTPVRAIENFFAGGLLKGPDAVESGFDLQSTLRLMVCAVAGTLSGAGTTVIEIKAAGGATIRIRATVDSKGNRTVTLLDVT